MLVIQTHETLNFIRRRVRAMIMKEKTAVKMILTRKKTRRMQKKKKVL